MVVVDKLDDVVVEVGSSKDDTRAEHDCTIRESDGSVTCTGQAVTRVVLVRGTTSGRNMTLCEVVVMGRRFVG